MFYAAAESNRYYFLQSGHELLRIVRRDDNCLIRKAEYYGERRIRGERTKITESLVVKITGDAEQSRVSELYGTRHCPRINLERPHPRKIDPRVP